MAKKKQRSSRPRAKHARRGRQEIAAIQALLGTPGPQAQLNQQMFEREAEFFATRPPLSAQAQRQRGSWQREGKVVAREFVDVVSVWQAGRTTTLPDIHFPARDLLHVYGADRTGNAGADFYAFEWTSIDPFAGTGSFARANRRDGTMGAGHYTTSGWLHAYAAIGVQLIPKIGAGFLSVRPYLNWAGNDLLQHRVFDASLNEQRWGVAEGSFHIVVQSTPVGGGAAVTNSSPSVFAWRRAELNPQGASDHSGTISSADGLALDVPCTSDRKYVVWVVCKAAVFADPGFAVSTRSSISMTCDMPFLVVEEIPA